MVSPRDGWLWPKSEDSDHDSTLQGHERLNILCFWTGHNVGRHYGMAHDGVTPAHRNSMKELIVGLLYLYYRNQLLKYIYGYRVYSIKKMKNCSSLWPSGIGSRLGQNRLWVRFLAVSDIYPMFIEPTITWVPSGFSGYIWLDTKIVFKKKRIDLFANLNL